HLVLRLSRRGRCRRLLPTGAFSGRGDQQATDERAVGYARIRPPNRGRPSNHDRSGSEGRVTDASLVVIEPLHELTSSSVSELVVESERFGLRLVRRLTEEWASGVNRFDRPGEILFGAFIDGRLVGVCGLNVDPYAGNERVGRVRHLSLS